MSQYDVIAQLGQLRLQQPENLAFKQAWHKLLSDRYVNLEAICSEKILGDVTVIQE